MLNETEIELLKMLKGKGWVKEEDIPWPVDKKRRTAYFLSTKGLVEFKEEKEVVERESPQLQELKEVLSRLDQIQELKEIPPYLIGLLKELGAIKIEKGKIVEKRKVEIPEEFIKRKKLYQTEEKKKYYYKILPEGERMLEKVGTGTPYLGSKNFKGPFRRPYLDWEHLATRRIGRKHIISQWKEKVRKIFLEMGFEEMEGDYVQLSFWNFDMLFQPQDHPSRELADTFYLPKKGELDVPPEVVKRVKEIHEKYWKYEWDEEEAKKLVLRTHTTVLSALTLYKRKTGKFFSVGKVFRNEAIDYKHLAEFHQIEGIVSYPGLNFRHLLHTLKEFYRRLGYPDIRFRPSYFPYTEPSVEIEAYYEPRNEWVEVGGAGVFRKQVSEMLGAPYPVLAFGLALERPIMLMHPEVKDIRKLYQHTYSTLF
ncbi:MAG: phenylalanine--tRNA ligase subunit alpha [Candidatus Micrarchaeota archaeon]|nr:phenylalanine--tRNA ligase subunit alpha [Candidatus Micrarchaeota archaeon]